MHSRVEHSLDSESGSMLHETTSTRDVPTPAAPDLTKRRITLKTTETVMQPSNTVPDTRQIISNSEETRQLFSWGEETISTTVYLGNVVTTDLTKQWTTFTDWYDVPPENPNHATVRLRRTPETWEAFFRGVPVAGAGTAVYSGSVKPWNHACTSCAF